MRSYIAIVALATVACADSAPPPADTTPPAATAAPATAAPPPAMSAQTPQPTPEIFFREPVDGAMLSATFPVVFGLRNYGVAPAGVNVSRTGHFHVLIDVEPPAAGVVVPTDSLHRHFGTGAIGTTLSLAPGSYTLRLVLADFEHKVIGPELISAPIKVMVH
jgi:hypothetical protein